MAEVEYHQSIYSRELHGDVPCVKETKDPSVRMGDSSQRPPFRRKTSRLRPCFSRMGSHSENHRITLNTSTETVLQLHLASSVEPLFCADVHVQQALGTMCAAIASYSRLRATEV